MPGSAAWFNSGMPVVTIYWYEGRSEDQKARIASAITDALVSIGKTQPEACEIIFQDVRRADWAIAGRLQHQPPT
jgi:4-oxalocrotonate tautomerase